LFAKLVDGNGKELFDYTPSAKFLINILFKNETGNEGTIQRIADEGVIIIIINTRYRTCGSVEGLGLDKI